MNVRTLLMISVALVIAPVGCATKAKTPAPPTIESSTTSSPTGGSRQQAITVRATVDKIDLKTRRVTLIMPDGSKETMVVGEEARNLAQVKRGDEVVATYYQSVAFQVLKPGEAEPALAAGEGGARAPLGAKPGGVAARTVTLVAEIVKLDRANQVALLKGPEGNMISVNVRNPENFDKVKVGDTVEITFTEAVGIDVQPAPRR